MKEETKIERQACSLIYKRLGIIGIKLNVKGGRGWPDRMFLLPGGKPLLVEFKRPGEVPRPNQDKIHERLRTNGYLVATCDNALRTLNLVLDTLSNLPLTKREHQVLNAINEAIDEATEKVIHE